MAGGRWVEEEEDEMDCSSSLVDEDEVEGLGESGYLRREIGCERPRLKSGR